MALPAPVIDHLLTLVVGGRSPAYLLVDPAGRLLDWGGDPGIYGLTRLERGADVGAQVDVLASLFPLAEWPLLLPRVQMKPGVFADVHVFHQPEGEWVVLLDTSREAVQEGLLQQGANDLRLLRHKQHRILRQYLGKDADLVEKMAQGLLDVEEAGERREVTILAGRVRGFAAFAEGHPPGAVFETLDLCTRTLGETTLGEGGLVDTLSGDEVRAVFGVLPAAGPSGAQAVRAAMRMIEAVRGATGTRMDRAPPARLELGIGVASGPVALSVVRGQGVRAVRVLGDRVDLAAHLERRARAWEVAIDHATFEHLGPAQVEFQPLRAAAEDTEEPAPLYSRVL